MQVGKPADPPSVRGCDIEDAEVRVAADQVKQILRCVQLSNPRLDGNLPDADRTDERLIGRRRKSLAHSAGHALRRIDAPEQNMRVDQELQSPTSGEKLVPSSIRRPISSLSASKSGEMRILPR